MDSENRIVSAVSVESGRVAALGDNLQPRGSDARVIDLKGATVVPGLIDNHIHFLRTGLLPGHDMRELETAFSINVALERIQARATRIPEGELLSAIGGIHPAQFAENRYPTIKELDDAAPRNPVYISISNWGPGATNSLAKELLETQGARVGEDGVVSRGDDTFTAWKILSCSHSYADTVRQTADQLNFAASLGLTSVFDMGGTIKAGGWLDPATGYNPVLDLMHDDRLPIRLRLFFPALDENAQISDVTNRLNYSFCQFGNDLVRTSGVGEWLIPSRLQRKQPLPEFYLQSARKVAERGWVYKQHMVTLAEQKAHLDIWEKVNKEFSVGDLHWSMDHCYGIDQETLERCIELGIGLSCHGSPYLEGKLKPPGNPPFRMIIDSGIRAGGGSDGARIAPMNPWIMIYYSLTGKNHAGELINPDQSLTRQEALKIWTANQGWFCKEEQVMGGLEVGKFGDLVVLDKDYFDETEVSNADVRHLKSILTVVGGTIVHNACVL